MSEVQAVKARERENLEDRSRDFEVLKFYVVFLLVEMAELDCSVFVASQKQL